MKEVNGIALKEWAVAIEALTAGEQIIIMRKGGIIEETRDFQVESKAFFLFPTYEHQRSELLKDVYQPRLEPLIQSTAYNCSSIIITSYAEVAAEHEVHTKEELDKLFPFHIWTEHFAEERLKWKRNKPLHVLVLRIFKLDLPLEIPMIEEYTGCKSWIRLNAPLSGNISMKPVIKESEFLTQKLHIEELLQKR